jgi:hypothetical protein
MIFLLAVYGISHLIAMYGPAAIHAMGRQLQRIR